MDALCQHCMHRLGLTDETVIVRIAIHHRKKGLYLANDKHADEDKQWSWVPIGGTFMLEFDFNNEGLRQARGCLFERPKHFAHMDLRVIRIDTTTMKVTDVGLLCSARALVNDREL